MWCVNALGSDGGQLVLGVCGGRRSSGDNTRGNVCGTALIAEGARRFLLGKRSMSLESWILAGVVWCRLVSKMRKVALNFLPVRVYLAV